MNVGATAGGGQGPGPDPEAVIWHDLECGVYRQDLSFWRDLAADCGDPVLDIGAGSGRVSLELARAGHSVTALDSDPVLLEALRRRAAGLPVATVTADARDFALDERFALVVVPMQTIQLLGGVDGRLKLLRRAHRHLVPAGVLAIAIAPEFDEFTAGPGDPLPLPDMVELDGTVYASQPTAVRSEADRVWLERTREVVDPYGNRRTSEDRIALDRLGSSQLIGEAIIAGFRAVGTHSVAETDEHIGSLVVIFRA